MPPTPPTAPTPRSPRPVSPVSGISDAIAMPGPAAVPPATREQQMRAILDALARGEITVTEADRRLAALERMT